MTYYHPIVSAHQLYIFLLRIPQSEQEMQDPLPQQQMNVHAIRNYLLNKNCLKSRFFWNNPRIKIRKIYRYHHCRGILHGNQYICDYRDYQNYQWCIIRWLYPAISGGNILMVRYILKNLTSEVHRSYALILAYKYNRRDIFNYIFDQVDTKIDDECSTFDYTINILGNPKYWNKSMASSILDIIDDIDRLMTIICENNHIKLLELILSKYVLNQDTINRTFRDACVYERHTIIHMIYAAGPPINRGTPLQCGPSNLDTGLLMLCNKNNVPLIHQLICWGAKPNISTTCAALGHLDIQLVFYMMEIGNISDPTYEILHHALSTRKLAVVDSLIKYYASKLDSRQTEG